MIDRQFEEFVMSEFEREILNRIPDIKQRQAEATRQRALEVERNRYGNGSGSIASEI
jgi:hypothetical protein